ncbi:carbohydrate kinase family protein [Herbiconiux liangxiaofengii]|uniref:carbohydrate kinase family protein n=1 Tax=Herbiconiux liangxiaofengii TaxID=3342795 RepID=UPI0035B9DB79
MADPIAATPSLVCIGNLTIDTAVHHGVPSEPAMGGDAAYAALAARRHLDSVRMLAPVGTDLPDGVLDSLVAAGVGIDGLPARELPTVRNIVTYDADGTRTWHMLASEDDFDVLSVYPADVDSAALSASGILVSAMSLESQLALGPWLRPRTDATIYLDLQEDYLEGNREALLDLVGLCDVFLPSEIEAVTLAQTTDLEKAARLFAERGASVVVIKRAENGCLVLADSAAPVVEVPASPVEPVDSTGAGDAFCGAFAAVHLLTGDPIAAAEAGAAAARVAIGAFGIDGLLAAHPTSHPAAHDRTARSEVR